MQSPYFFISWLSFSTLSYSSDCFSRPLRCRSGGDYQSCFSTASSSSSLCLPHITLPLFGSTEDLTFQRFPDGPLPIPQKPTSHLICGATHSTQREVSYGCFLVEGCL